MTTIHMKRCGIMLPAVIGLCCALAMPGFAGASHPKAAPVEPETNARLGKMQASQTDPRQFDTLDAYLAHLKVMGTRGRAYYRPVGADLYEYVPPRGRGPQQPPQMFTRAQLMSKFGFER
jgi:hypothetical protein